MLLREIRRNISLKLREVRNQYYRVMGVEIGRNVFISSGAWLDVQDGKIIIENNVRITNGCKILSHDYSVRVMGDQPNIAITKIGENSFLGMNVVVLPGVSIGRSCIIGAGCVVAKNVPDYSVLVGSKPRIVKQKNPTTDLWDVCDIN
jgi:acetyltransferase-like isoleucine patch superfamily enzyme